MNEIVWKRVYDEQKNGTAISRERFRVLIDRLWPRGLSKEDLHVDYWAREIAPSADLRRRYHHDELSYEEFTRRYRRELETNPAMADFITLLRRHLDQGITLLYASKTVEASHVPVLRDYMAHHLNKDSAAGQTSLAGQVSLFFVANNTVLIKSVPFDEAEPEGDTLNYPYSHFRVWKENFQQFYHQDHDYFPRGRIVYNRDEDSYTVFHEKCIADEVRNLQARLPEGKSRLSRDYSYRCHHCREEDSGNE